MKDIQRKINRFFAKNRDKGIPNLMLYVIAGTAIVYILDMIDPSQAVSSFLYFDRELILQGQVWRLITFSFTNASSNIVLTAIMYLCYYQIGQTIESIWGTLRFNVFYFSGVLLMDVFCMLFGGYASAYYLNLSLFLAYATLFPDAQFYLFFIIPVKAWVLAIVDLVVILIDLFVMAWPYNIFPVIALANYFLFFGKDVANIIPRSWRYKLMRKAKGTSGSKPKTIPFRPAQQPEYTHKCTVCGRTDVSDPELEFRYCSRCSGYHCYCQDHISNHTHIQ